MIEVKISEMLGEKCPKMVLGIICCDVTNSEYNEQLWQEIKNEQERIIRCFNIEDIKEQHNINATRLIYKACGKDPHRYRPSAESLYRRLIKRNELYQINTLVDLINLFSLKTGYSLGGFDADLIKGMVIAGVGEKNEKFEGIGRGELNIEGLPVIRDEIGGIGTPTSDEARTAIRINTTKLFLNVNGYTGRDMMEPFLVKAIEYLKLYVNANHIEKNIINYQ